MRETVLRLSPFRILERRTVGKPVDMLPVQNTVPTRDPPVVTWIPTAVNCARSAPKLYAQPLRAQGGGVEYLPERRHKEPMRQP
jgi:hypothetical protein